MSTDQTTNLGLPFLMPAQAQKHVTVNESLTRLDALVQMAVESRAVSSQPGSPADGAAWIAPAGKTGAEWGGYADWSLAYYRDGAWEQITPREGWRAWVKDEAVLVRYDGAGWVTAAADPSAVGPLAGVTSLNGGPLAGFRNAVINGDFRIAQRGTSFTGVTSTIFTMDRWQTNPSGGTMDVSQQAFSPGQTDVAGEPEHFLRVQCTSADDNVGMITKIESVRTFAGRRVLLAFDAKAAAAMTLRFHLDQEFGSGGSTHVANNGVANVDLTTSWQRFAAVIDLPSIAGKTIGAGDHVALVFRNPNNETFTLDLANVSVEPWPDGASAPADADDAPPFERRPLGLEQALAERYFEQTYAPGVAAGTTTTTGERRGVRANGSGAFHVPYRTQKRASPTVTLYSAATGASGKARDYNAGADITASAANASHDGFNASVSAAGVGAGVGVHFTADAEL